MHAHLHTRTHTRTHAHTHPRIYARVHMHACMHACVSHGHVGFCLRRRPCRVHASNLVVLSGFLTRTVLAFGSLSTVSTTALSDPLSLHLSCQNRRARIRRATGRDQPAAVDTQPRLAPGLAQPSLAKQYPAQDEPHRHVSLGVALANNRPRLLWPSMEPHVLFVIICKLS